MKRRDFLMVAAAAILPPAAMAQETVDAMRFSSLQPGAPLPDWLQPYVFPNQPRHTQFTLVEDGGRTVLAVRANASSSGLLRRVRIDPRRHPILSWRWKVMNLPHKGDIATKAGDDFAVRIYLTFDLDTAKLSLGDRFKLSLARTIWGDQLPAAALCYVWDGRAPVDTMAPNAYTDRVRMVVADSGGAELGRWVARERDVAADFRRAFGMQPPPITAIIVSADTDNTGESVESCFGDLEFRARRTS
jgi:Protein of unknown function (DUF3047)